MMWRHVVHARIEDYLRLGWVVVIPGRWTHHDNWSVPMRWLCECRPVELVSATQRFPLSSTQSESN
jgi:hypothetical protein